ncbi:hypothetical protein FB107DRAFT_213825 [Schizophyllum commune]
MWRLLRHPARCTPSAFLRCSNTCRGLSILRPSTQPLRSLSTSLARRTSPTKGLTLSDAQRKTIYALSTPPGRGGIAVIRISGPDALQAWERLVVLQGRQQSSLPKPWRAYRCRVVHPSHKEPIDDGLAIYFRGPKSFTTEDVVELHVHSGRAIVSSILSAISALPFCRPAEAGEFTKRAFLGGRLDLTQAEGLKDLIDAETEGQRRIALSAARGSNRALYEDLRNRAIHCLAQVEALIDFGEGDDIEDGVLDQARAEARELLASLHRHLADGRRGEIVRAGVRLALFGPPNAGKSSLLNCLAQREAAIVTPVPGTTRDILELGLDLGGLAIRVSDTAGLRATHDEVEAIGIERAKRAIEGADVALCILSLPDCVRDGCIQIPEYVKAMITPETYFLFNKSDLATPEQLEVAASAPRSWVTSLITKEGTSAFIKGFTSELQTRYHLHGVSEDPPLITHARHRVHLESAARFVQAFLESSDEDLVMGAEELRYAAQAIGKISGHIDVEDILDSVFNDFCIGK